MLVTFLVSQESQHYYTHNGLLETIDKKNAANNWYFDFKNSPQHHEINLDTNTNVSNELIMFINFKMFDKKFHYIGATGVGIQVSYINEMLTMFKNNFKLKVSFVDSEGLILFKQNKKSSEAKHIDEIEGLSAIKDQLLSKQ